MESISRISGLYEYTPFPNDYTLFVYIYSIVAFVSLYYSSCYLFSLFESTSGINVSDDWKAEELRKEKIRSWIVTTMSSFIMTVSSIPFCYDLLTSGFDVARIQSRDALSQGMTAFFMAYLLSDCLLGCCHYRSQFNLLTGWIHHGSYTILLTFILRAKLSHCFLLAAIMELPTFFLALGMVVPVARNDELFTVLFFLTRIVLHTVLVGLYGSSYGRMYGSGLFNPSTMIPMSTSIPLVGLLLAAPLHIMWFTSSTKGLLKRRKAARNNLLAATSIHNQNDINPSKTPSSLPTSPPISFLSTKPSSVSLASSYLVSSSQRISIPFRRRQLATRMNIELIVRDYFKLPRITANGTTDDHEHFRSVVGRIDSTREMMWNLRMRAGKGGDELKRFGGRIKRRVGGMVDAM